MRDVLAANSQGEHRLLSLGRPFSFVFILVDLSSGSYSGPSMSKRFTLYASGTSLRSSWELVSLHVLRSADTIQTVRWHPGDRREGEQNMKRSYGLLRLRWVPLCTGITSGPQGVYNQFSLKSIFVYLFIAEVKRYRSTTHGGKCGSLSLLLRLRGV